MFKETKNNKTAQFRLNTRKNGLDGNPNVHLVHELADEAF